MSGDCGGKGGTSRRPAHIWLYPPSPPLLTWSGLLMISASYVSLVFSLFAIQMLLEALYLLLFAVSWLPSEAQLDHGVLPSWVKCCLIALQAACYLPGRS